MRPAAELVRRRNAAIHQISFDVDSSTRCIFVCYCMESPVFYTTIVYVYIYIPFLPKSRLRWHRHRLRPCVSDQTIEPRSREEEKRIDTFSSRRLLLLLLVYGWCISFRPHFWVWTDECWRLERQIKQVDNLELRDRIERATLYVPMAPRGLKLKLHPAVRAPATFSSHSFSSSFPS